LFLEVGSMFALPRACVPSIADNDSLIAKLADNEFYLQVGYRMAQLIKRKNSHLHRGTNQGCQIFLGAKFQDGEKYTKSPQNTYTIWPHNMYTKWP
jgi:hypothetical protein